MVEAMAGFVMPDDEICRLVIDQKTHKPIGEGTLKNHFREELDSGRSKIRMRHHMALFKAVEAGNVTAQIWWDKTRNHIDEHKPAGVQVNMTQQSVAHAEVAQIEPEKRSQLDLARRIAFTLAQAAQKPRIQDKEVA